MKITSACHVPIDKIETFLNTVHGFNKDGLLKEGYVVEMDEEIKGCFVLSTTGNDIYWLKQLYIAKEAAANLPVLLETILQMTKGKQAKKLYVYSHQPVVDLLLEALQFYPQSKEKWAPTQSKKEGNWWAYHVS
ncbi:MAG TPA: hypothetical protein VK072_08875 [Candidatus Avamphibacillus sp.]|nr:hypothetical protein [Candidatus Avamphibacillus sp.]